jgi:hypothetical protein
MYSMVRDGKLVWPYCTECGRRLRLLGSIFLRHFEVPNWCPRKDDTFIFDIDKLPLVMGIILGNQGLV